MQIKKYEDKAILAFFIGWTLFYQDPSPYLEYIVLDVFYTTRIITLRATQFEKMIT